MDHLSVSDDVTLARKIARLVEERGWNQEDFARIANLNRHTVRQIMKADGDRNLRNATISQCAHALGLQVNELREVALERLLPRMQGRKYADNTAVINRLLNHSLTDRLKNWIQENPIRASKIRNEEIDQILHMDGPEGIFERFGMEHGMERLERRRRLCEKVTLIYETEYLDFLEQFVGMIFDKIQSGKHS
ncbi:MAG: helix-turn-helix transcriptional regulator [Zavarzinella sp.]